MFTYITSSKEHAALVPANRGKMISSFGLDRLKALLILLQRILSLLPLLPRVLITSLFSHASATSANTPHLCRTLLILLATLMTAFHTATTMPWYRVQTGSLLLHPHTLLLLPALLLPLFGQILVLPGKQTWSSAGCRLVSHHWSYNWLQLLRNCKLTSARFTGFSGTVHTCIYCSKPKII